MNYSPKQKNKAPDIWVLALFISAAVMALFGNYNGIKGRGILQSISLILFGVMIYVLVRFKYSNIRYTVRRKSEGRYGDEDGDEILRDADGKELPVTAYPPEKLEMVIEKSQGKRGYVAECLIALDDITSCRPVPSDKAERKKLIRENRKNKKFRYSKNMVGGEMWLISVATKEGTASIFFECDDGKMTDYLRAVAKYNSDNRKGEDN